MEISEKILKLVFSHLFVYEESITKYTWEFDENDDFVKKQKIEKTYYIDYGEVRDEISLEEYNEFLRIESLIKQGE